MKKAIFSSILVFFFCLGSSLAQNIFYFAQVGDGKLDALVFKTTIILVNTGATTTVKIEFFNTPAGTPMTVTLGTLGSRNTFEFTLQRGESFSAQTPGTSSIQVGYAKVTTQHSGVGGTAVFTRLDGNRNVLLYEAGVPASPTLNSFSLFLDSLGDKDTGLAIVNTGIGSANVNLTLRNKAFTNIATTTIPLSRGNHRAQFINEIFTDFSAEAKEMEGSVTVQSDQPLAAVTLRTNDSGRPFPEAVPALTAFPVVSGRADATADGSFSLLSSGDVLISLDTTGEKPRVLGALYRLYDGDTLVDELVRSVDSSSVLTDVIAVPKTTPKRNINRVEVQLIHSGGQLSAPFHLSH